ncbi:MAG: MBL fold metallo-hydrolase, partial [Bacteroidetes bacterium]|nr:MBL fold metallo-hydrolase [Fibrella sp.]
TDVILSHAHTDHIVGLIDPQHQLLFANADIYISKTEYDFWQGATLADFKNSPVYQMPDFVNQTITAIQTVLNRLTSRVQFMDMTNGLHGIFSFEPAPGHTPGHTLITIHSAGESLLNIVDLIQSDAVLFAHPEWGFFGDTDLQQAIESRINMLKRLSASGTRAFAYHLPWPGLGHVRQKEAAFEWVPDVYTIP